MEQARSNAFGGTDCAQPMVYALQKGLKASAPASKLGWI